MQIEPAASTFSTASLKRSPDKGQNSFLKLQKIGWQPPLNPDTTENIALALREHHLQHADGWKFQAIFQQLYTWCDRIIEDFRLPVGRPVLQIDEGRQRNSFAHYHPGRSPSIGTKRTICFNPSTLAGPTHELVQTLIHEILHGREEVHGRWRNGKGSGSYHTKRWRVWMLEFGIVADEHGIHHGVTDGFWEYVGRYGLTPDERLTVPAELAPAKKKASLLKFLCPEEHRDFYVTSDYKGRGFKCPVCGCDMKRRGDI